MVKKLESFLPAQLWNCSPPVHRRERKVPGRRPKTLVCRSLCEWGEQPLEGVQSQTMPILSSPQKMPLDSRRVHWSQESINNVVRDRKLLLWLEHCAQDFVCIRSLSLHSNLVRSGRVISKMPWKGKK